MSELDRILSIPVYEFPPEAELKAKWGEGLRGDQVRALEAVSVAGGGLLALGVGSGKTLISYLLSSALGVESSDVLVLCPAAVRSQYFSEYSKYVDWGFDVEPFGAIESYSKLSRTKSLLDLHPSPKLIIADEAHNLAWASSAAARSGRTKKFLRAFASLDPQPRFVAMSATLTTTSVLDYAHLAELALGEGSPLPTSFTRLEAWSRILDSARAGNPPLSEDWWQIRGLWEDERFDPPNGEELGAVERARRAFQARLVSVPGFVRSTEASCDEPLTVHRVVPAGESASALAKLSDRVEKTYVLPDGEEIDSPLIADAKLRQLSQGFYYREVWPDGEVDWEYKEARSDWNREVSRVLGANRRGLDTPGEVEAEIRAGRPYDAAVHAAWLAWDAVRGRPGPDKEAVWIDGGVLDDAVARARVDGRRVIVWYSYEAVAAGLVDRGVEVVWPGGEVDPDGPGVVGLSVWSHGTGLNLQSYDVHCVLCPPSGGGIWEQLIGRIHRAGRVGPVDVWAYSHTRVLKKALTSARADSKYINETQGLPMRLLLATYEEEKNK